VLDHGNDQPGAERLAAAVRAGTGLAGWHGGIVDCFHDHNYHLLTGGEFAMHPPGFHDHTVHLLPERADHPVIASRPAPR
jgi:type 1 glutamine amidotransferase